MSFKEKMNEVIKRRKSDLDSEFKKICVKIYDIYSNCSGISNIKVYCNRISRELEFVTINCDTISIKNENWQLIYDAYFTNTNEYDSFYEALRVEVHERLGIDAEFEYSNNGEKSMITALNVSIANFIKKEWVLNNGALY